MAQEKTELPSLVQALAGQARQHPGRFGLALIFAGALSMLPTLLEWIVAPQIEIPAYASWALGVFGFLVALLVPRYVVLRKSMVHDPDVLTLLYVIEKAQLSEMERHQSYRQLIDVLLKKIAS